MKKIALYIHIPFCKQKCLYCDFPSYSHKEELMDKYIEALNKEILEKTKEVEALETQNFEAIEGKGIKASINNNTYFAGNETLMKENNIKLSEAEGIYQKLYGQAKTVIFVSDDEKLLGIIAISDTVKQTSIEAINGFKDLKIET